MKKVFFLIMCAVIATVSNAQDVNPMPLGKTYEPLRVGATLVAKTGFKIGENLERISGYIYAAAPMKSNENAVVVFKLDVETAKKINTAIIPEDSELLLFVYTQGATNYLGSLQLQKKKK